MKNSLQTAPTFHSRAVKKAHREETKRLHFEESQKFRNPIIGIEVTLEEKLKENETLFRGSLVKKKNLLIDALEDLSLTSYGFSDQLKQVISCWRKPTNDDIEIKLRISKHDIENTQKQLDDLKSEIQELDETISGLLDEINQADQEINEIKQKTEDAKNQLFYNSSRFAKIRMTKDSITEIQNKYEQMFITPFKPKYHPDNLQFVEENNNQKKILDRLHYEVQISNQISSHLKNLNGQKK